MFLYAPSDTIINRVLIGENCALWQYVFMYDPKDALCCHVWRSQSLHSADAFLARTFHDSDYRGFLFVAAHWTARVTFTSSSVIHFIHLHRSPLQLHVSFGQQRANLAEHSPCGFVGNSGFALNLLCRNSATSGSHQVHRSEEHTS